MGMFRKWTKLLDKVPESDREAWVRASLKDKRLLFVFGKYFFPDVIRGEVPYCHVDLIRELSRRKNSAIIFPRGFAKSTWEKIDTLHDIVYGLEPVIIYISDTLENAGFHFESIKNHLETNNALRQVYGNLVPDPTQPSAKWTNKHFQTTNGVNVVARGAGKGRGVNIKDDRPTKIIVDDAETDEQVHSTARRKKYHNWLYNVIFPSLDKKRGFIKVIGTVIHPECEVLKFYKGHGGIFRRAIEEGQSIWPKYWDLESLYRLRDGYTDDDGVQIAGIGTRAFSQEYMNEPINDDTSIFKQDWLDRNTYGEEEGEEHLPPRVELEVRMAVDPQAGESDMADFLGICVVGRSKVTGKRYVLHAEKFKGSIDKQVEKVDAIYTKWNPVLLGVEKVMNQTALFQLLRAKGKYRLRALSPAGQDKVERAKLIEPLVELGFIKFSPYHIDLYNELIQFPNGEHDDLVDAFVYANSMFAGTGVKSKGQKLQPPRKKVPAMVTQGLQSKKF